MISGSMSAEGAQKTPPTIPAIAANGTGTAVTGASATGEVSPLKVPPPRPRQGGLLLRLGGLLGVLFLGYKVIPFYYYYFDIKSNCSQVLRNAVVKSDEELRRDLREIVARDGISVEGRDIGIQRVGSRIKIWLHYQEHLEVTLMGKTLTLYTFDFTPAAERALEE